MNWDSSTIWIIVAVVALLALYFYNRSRPAPRGTYDDKNTRSSGSIGGGDRAYDDKNTRSSGSIGGGDRAYDAPDQSSRGSIGGGPVSQRTAPGPLNGNRTIERDLNRDLDRDVERGIDRDSPLERLADERAQQANSQHANPVTRNNVDDERHPDNERFKSKGSIGG